MLFQLVGDMHNNIRFKDIRIPEPCHEDWNKMTPEEQGRFCASCQKVVYDFTRATEEEFNELVAEKGKVCGRFREDQIASNEPVEKPFWTTFRKYVASTGAVILFKMLTVQSSFAQTVNTGGKGVEVQMPDLREKRVLKGNQTIKGELVEKRYSQISSVKNGVVGAVITLEDGEGNILAQTNTGKDGKFELVVPDTVDWSHELVVVAEKEKQKSIYPRGATRFKRIKQFISDTAFLSLEMEKRFRPNKTRFRLRRRTRMGYMQRHTTARWWK